jgi:hypothetical protein
MFGVNLYCRIFIDITKSIYINFQEFMFSYELKNDEKVKQLG